MQIAYIWSTFYLHFADIRSYTEYGVPSGQRELPRLSRGKKGHTLSELFNSSISPAILTYSTE
jgi:hypothetical protein